MTFAEKVYEAVRRIPEGKVATYGQIAEAIGCPGGARAVGNALHANPYAPRDRFSPRPLEPLPVESRPISPLGAHPDSAVIPGHPAHADSAVVPCHTAHPDSAVVPCHRVVAADGSLAANFGCGGPSVQYERLKTEGVAFLPAAPGSLPRVNLRMCKYRAC